MSLRRTSSVPLTHLKKLSTLSLNDLISQRIHDVKLNLTEIAENLNTTERTLHRRVKSLTGLTPNQYLRAYRLREAKRLLAINSYGTLKELALSVGFSNQTYFAELFQKEFGSKPKVR